MRAQRSDQPGPHGQSRRSSAPTAPSGSRGSSRPPRDEEAQRERLEAFHQQLTDQVLALANGPAWKSWLETAARFHHYSSNNTVAIMLQRPDACHTSAVSPHCRRRS